MEIKKGVYGRWIGLLVVLLAVLFYYQNYYISASDLYKLNSDCAERAIKFAENKTGEEYRNWRVIQNMFNIGKKSCFGEFSFRNSTGGVTNTIYDLALNKEMAFVPSFDATQIRDDNTLKYYSEFVRKYETVKSEIFGATKDK